MIDSKIGFGTCVHCGFKISLNDNADSVASLLHDAEEARKDEKVVQLGSYVEKILKADPENAKGWILKGCVTSRMGKVEEATEEWRKGLSLIRTAEERKEFFEMVKYDVFCGFASYAVFSLKPLNIYSFHNKIFDNVDIVADDSEAYVESLRFFDDVIDLLVPYMRKEENSTFFYKQLWLVTDMMKFSMFSEVDFRAAAAKAKRYAAVVEEFKTRGKTMKLFVSQKGERYIRREEIMKKNNIDSSMMEALVGMYNNYLPNSRGGAEGYWIKNRDEFLNTREQLVEAVNEYRLLVGNPLSTKRRSSKNKIESCLEKLSRPM
jgi:hypothetical protein